MTNEIKTLGNATINRYFEVGTIKRINRLKPVNCRTKFTNIALIKFVSRSLPVKVRLKKNLEAEKLDGNR
jgi:hypothetical protein